MRSETATKVLWRQLMTGGFLLGLCAVALAQQSTPVAPKLEPRPFAWTKLALALPISIQVFAGEAVNADGLPVRAWIADIDYNDLGLRAKAVLSQATLGREPTSTLARSVGATVAVNGGYFDMKSMPSQTYSLVLSDGKSLAKNVATASRPNGKYFLTRGAFGIRADRSFDIAWIAHLDNEVWSYSQPSPNTPQFIAPAPNRNFPTNAQLWPVVEGIGGGPVLVKNGQLQDTWQAEVFPLDLSTRPHPRVAVGFRPDRHLILFVADGRQPNWSSGLTTQELGAAMQQLGCSDALNLDGGGSSTFVVNGEVLNRPSDGRERNVSSILAIIPAAN